MDKQEEGLKLLRDITHINSMIAELQQQIEMVYTVLTSTTSKPKDVNVQSSGSMDPMGDRVIIALKYQSELIEYQHELIERKNKIMEVIDNLSYENQEYIMYKYINCLTLEEIADKKHYTSRWIWDKIRAAEIEFIEQYERVHINS